MRPRLLYHHQALCLRTLHGDSIPPRIIFYPSSLLVAHFEHVPRDGTGTPTAIGPPAFNISWQGSPYFFSHNIPIVASSTPPSLQGAFGSSWGMLSNIMMRDMCFGGVSPSSQRQHCCRMWTKKTYQAMTTNTPLGLNSCRMLHTVPSFSTRPAPDAVYNAMLNPPQPCVFNVEAATSTHTLAIGLWRYHPRDGCTRGNCARIMIAGARRLHHSERARPHQITCGFFRRLRSNRTMAPPTPMSAAALHDVRFPAMAGACSGLRPNFHARVTRSREWMGVHPRTRDPGCGGGATNYQNRKPWEDR